MTEGFGSELQLQKYEFMRDTSCDRGFAKDSKVVARKQATNIKRYIIRIAIWAVLWLGMTVFIFVNSLQSGEQSGSQSGWWAAFLRPILDSDKVLTDVAFHTLVRKLAHMAEFCVLAVTIGGTTAELGKRMGRRYICLPLLAALCTAVCDEFLQTFTSGRAGQVQDVLIDMAGALIGFGLVIAVCGLWKTMRKRREKVCEN